MASPLQTRGEGILKSEVPPRRVANLSSPESKTTENLKKVLSLIFFSLLVAVSGSLTPTDPSDVKSWPVEKQLGSRVA